MGIWLLFLLAWILLFFILLILPLGFTVKGKIVMTGLTGILAILVWGLKEVIPIWQLILVILLSILLVSYFFEKKWHSILFIQPASEQPAFAIAEVQLGRASSGDEAFFSEKEDKQTELLSEISLEELTSVTEIEKSIDRDENKHEHMMEDLEEILNRDLSEVEMKKERM